MPDSFRDRDYDRKQCWKRRTGLEKRLIMAAFVLGAIALIFLIATILKRSCTSSEECSTKYCVKAAAELLEFVDLKVDPCDDFYRYACGSYFKNAVKKDSPSPWTSTGKLFENEMKGLVVNPIKGNESNAEIAMKQFYQECMNTTKIDRDRNKHFLATISELGGWPLVNETARKKPTELDWAEWYIKAKQLGLPVIGFFGFESKQTKSNITILKVTGPQMNHDNHHLQSSEFTILMQELVEVFHGKIRRQEWHDIQNLQEKLYNHRSEKDPQNEDDDDDDDDATDDDLILTIQNLTETCPKVPWLKILTGLSGNASKFHNSSLVSYSEDYLRNYCEDLDHWLGYMTPQTVINFYIWSIIQNAHKYMDKHVRKVYEERASERFKECFATADERFKFVKETTYIRRRSSEKVRNDLFEMIEITKKLFVEHLAKCSWMDEPTRKEAIAKAERIISMVGADEDLYNIKKFNRYLGLDEFHFTSDNMFEMLKQKLKKENDHLFDMIYEPNEEDWVSFFSNAVEVNAFFLPSANAMIIPAPILTSIFYNKKFPAFMNYGPMGSTVGHELMHGFTEASREYELANGTEVDWWTNKTAELYREKVKCVIQEYESRVFRYTLNGTKTLEENIADYVGADIGYEAYQKYVEKHGTEQKLAGLPLTPDQIYWVQTATNFCFRKLDDNEVDYEEEDSHGIPAFRVEAPARNSYHFAKAFNCPVGARMNPKDKCQLL